MIAISSQSINNSKLIKTICLFFILTTSSVIVAQATITKTYSGGTVSIDAGTSSVPITFSASDFSNGFVIEKVSVSITWTKTDGSCDTQDTGDAWHTETGFQLQGPGGTVVLRDPGTWSGQDDINNVTTVFDDAFTLVPSGTPISGNFLPFQNLSFFNGNDPRMTWNLIGEDTVGSDPLCIESYSITITTTDTGTTCGNDVILNESPTDAFVGPAASCDNSTEGDPTSNTFSYDADTSCYDGVDVAVTIIPDNPNDSRAPGFETGDFVNITLTDDNGSTTTTIDGATYNGGNSNTFTATRINPGANLTIDVFIQITGNSNANNGTGCWERLRVTSILVTGSDATGPPEPTLAAQVFNCSATPVVPTTTDTCNSSIITGTTTTVFPITAIGTTVVTWVFTDACGNTTEVDQNITVNGCVDLNLTKTVDNSLPKVGESITYTITLINNGAVAATGVEVTDYTLPFSAALSYNSHTAYGTSVYDATTGVWDLSSETIPLNTPITLQIVATVLSAGQITNTAEVTKSDQIDIDSTVANNN